jgi:hypothetical protein
MRGTRDGDIDGFPLLRIVATKYLFRLDAKVFVSMSRFVRVLWSPNNARERPVRG